MSDNKTKDNSSKQPEHICPPFVAKILNSPFRTILENPERLLKPLIKKGDTIVDLGCGGGVFSVAAAKLTGESGKVYAVDLQQKMLDITKKLARKNGLEDNINCHLCNATSLDLEEELADLVIAFHMVHETGNPSALVKEIGKITKKDGLFLVMEPKMHVNKKMFDETTQQSEINGFVMEKDMSTLLGMGALYRKK